MQTELTERNVFEYIKNFCYDPIYTIGSILITTATDLTLLPFQFNSDVYYVKGAYVIHDNVLYQAIADGSGLWSPDTISNIYTGQGHYDSDVASSKDTGIRSGEEYIANTRSYGPYNPDRFKLIYDPNNCDDPAYSILLYQLINTRTQAVNFAFDNMRAARNYIRDYVTDKDYNINIAHINNTYIGTWDDHTLTFYEPEYS